jgi:two-component system nitrate/nitrite response regulator NarL
MRRRSIGTILIGPHSLLREGLIHILCEAKFRILASVASMSDLAAGAFQRYDRILLIIESGNNPSSVLPQITLFKEQHPHGRVAVLGGITGPPTWWQRFKPELTSILTAKKRAMRLSRR